MKLSAVVLLSVNLVAASQVAANASDTASFLQDTLASPGSTKTSDSKVAKAKVAQGQPAPARKRSSSYVAMTPVMDGVKCRPFMPGRYLPSESELQARKQAEIAAKQAEIAARQQAAQPFAIPAGVLSGQISKNNDMAALAPAAQYAMSRPVNQDYIHKVAQVAMQKVKQAAKTYTASHTRSVPGVNPVMPGQVAQIPGLSGIRIPEPQNSAPPAVAQVPQPPQAAQGSNVGNNIVLSPELTQYESNQLDKLVENNMPENVYQKGFNGDMKAAQGNPGLSGTGPSPFPLSSIPMNQAGRGRAISQPTAEARFGSWHGGSAGLTQSSFQSYVPIHMMGPMSVKVNQHNASHRTSNQSIATKTHAINTAAKAPVTEKPKAEVHAASYAPYRRYNLM
jgi:hypothetical protein